MQEVEAGEQGKERDKGLEDEGFLFGWNCADPVSRKKARSLGIERAGQDSIGSI